MTLHPCTVLIATMSNRVPRQVGNGLLAEGSGATQINQSVRAAAVEGTCGEYGGVDTIPLSVHDRSGGAQ